MRPFERSNSSDDVYRNRVRRAAAGVAAFSGVSAVFTGMAVYAAEIIPEQTTLYHESAALSGLLTALSAAAAIKQATRLRSMDGEAVTSNNQSGIAFTGEVVTSSVVSSSTVQIPTTPEALSPTPQDAPCYPPQDYVDN